jgi:hypothetical protein
MPVLLQSFGRFNEYIDPAPNRANAILEWTGLYRWYLSKSVHTLVAGRVLIMFPST